MHNSPLAIRVLIADDHAVVLEGLAAMIGRQGDLEIVARATDGRGAVELWKQHSPDVTLLDLRMPNLDGLGALRELRHRDEDVRVIMLTTYDTDENIYQALKAGAKAYLLKDTPGDKLLDCIRRVHAGETCISAGMAVKLAAHATSESLSVREKDVLILLAQGKSNKEIGTRLFISETTVKSHVQNVFAKLKVLSRTEAVAVAAQKGLIEL